MCHPFVEESVIKNLGVKRRESKTYFYANFLNPITFRPSSPSSVCSMHCTQHCTAASKFVFSFHQPKKNKHHFDSYYFTICI